MTINLKVLFFVDLSEISYFNIYTANALIVMRIMENNDRSVEVADLDAVAHFEEDLVLFIHSEDQNISSSLCVQANFDTKQFDLVQPLGVYLESGSYIPIQDHDTQISHRQRIQQEMSPDVIAEMLRDFAEKQRLKLEKLGISSNNSTGWFPGG